MGELFPTKELLQMVEERIPFGRFLTTVALVSVLLAIIATSCAILYRTAILPFSTLVINAFTTGKIKPANFASFIAGGVGYFIAYYLIEWLFRGQTRILKETLAVSQELAVREIEVLKVAEDCNRQTLEAVTSLQAMEARIDALEARNL